MNASRNPQQEDGWLGLGGMITDYGSSRLHVFIAHSRHSSSPKDHELTKLQPPNDFKIRNSDDLHVKILLQYFELIGKHCG